MLFQNELTCLCQKGYLGSHCEIKGKFFYNVESNADECLELYLKDIQCILRLIQIRLNIDNQHQHA